MGGKGIAKVGGGGGGGGESWNFNENHLECFPRAQCLERESNSSAQMKRREMGEIVILCLPSRCCQTELLKPGKSPWSGAGVGALGGDQQRRLSL